MMRRKKATQTLVVCGLLVAASVICWRWFETVQPQICRLPDGSTMTLLGTTYGRHHRWTSLERGQGLWAELQSLLHPKWQVSQLETPTDVLVLWIKVDRAKGIPFFFDFAPRIEVSDALGNRQVVEPDRYPVSQMTLQRDVTPLIIPTYPRRGKDLTVCYYRLHATYPRPDAVFHVPNPTPGNYPRWTPQPIPATQTSGDLQVTLTGISGSDQIMQGKFLESYVGGFGGSFGLGPKVKPWGLPFYGEDRRVAAHLRVQGKPWAQWQMSDMWVSDATGNVWSASSDGFARGGVPVDTVTYLTPVGGETLRYTVECNRGTAAPFPAQELWTLAPIKVPGPGQRLPIGVSHSDREVSLKLLGITGIGSTWAKPPRTGVQPRQDMPIVYLEVTGACRPYLYATDETGKRIQGGGGQNVADRWLQPDSPALGVIGNSLTEHYGFGPGRETRILTYPLMAPAGSKHLNLTFALNKTRPFVFTVPADAGLPAHGSN